LHGGISVKRGSEDRFGQGEILLKDERFSKKARDDANPVPRTDFVSKRERVFERGARFGEREEV